MNECQHAAKLQAYLDGELPARDAEQMADHLRQCTACAAQLNRLRALDSLLTGSLRPHIPDVTLYRLHMGVDRAATGVVQRTAEALAALAAMILIGCTIALATLSPTAMSSEAAVPVWEVTAVTGQTGEQAGQTSEDQLALWMAQDLSREQTHE